MCPWSGMRLRTSAALFLGTPSPSAEASLLSSHRPALVGGNWSRAAPFAVCLLRFGDVALEKLGELSGAAQRRAVAAVDLVGFDAEAVANQGTQPRCGEETVVPAQDESRRDVRPRR